MLKSVTYVSGIMCYLCLGKDIAQRVAAITAMRRMIEEDRRETDLQKLIEEFPWLLGPQWERLTANQEIRTLVEKKHKPDTDAGYWTLSDAQKRLKPDFVFLANVGVPEEIVVFELKGPEFGKTLNLTEYRQLREYLDILSEVYTNAKVSGVLVGHDTGGFKESDTRIEVRRWSDVLLEARSLHVAYLASLLEASNPEAGDARLKQISDFGGTETTQLLSRLTNIADLHPVALPAAPMAALPELKKASE